TWLHDVTIERRLSRRKPLPYAQTDVGVVGLSRLLASPDLLRRLPRGVQARLASRAIRPAGAAWLIDRLGEVAITNGRVVVQAKSTGAGVRVTLDDGSHRLVDHVILGTGYRVDVGAYPFLAPELSGAIRRVT